MIVNRIVRAFPIQSSYCHLSCACVKRNTNLSRRLCAVPKLFILPLSHGYDVSSSSSPGDSVVSIRHSMGGWSSRLTLDENDSSSASRLTSSSFDVIFALVGVILFCTWRNITRHRKCNEVNKEKLKICYGFVMPEWHVSWKFLINRLMYKRRIKYKFLEKSSIGPFLCAWNHSSIRLSL